MLIKRSWLLMGIVAVILGSALTFSGCIQQEKAIGDDYLLFQRSEMGTEYLHIAKNGYAEHTMYHSSSRKVNTHIVSGWKITAHNSGTLSEGDMRQLSEFIENSGFFKLAGSYPRIIRPFYGNPEYFAISVRKEGKVKSVYVYNGTPAPFNEVRDYLREKVKAQLENDPRYGTFIMAERVKGSTSENNLSEEDLEAHPFLAQAIRNPKWFIYIGSLENTKLGDYNPRGRNDIFVTFEDNKFRIRVIDRADESAAYSPGNGGDIIERTKNLSTTGVQITESAFVDTFNNEVTFMLGWEHGDLDLTLQRPDGTIVNPAVAQTDPDIEYVERDTYEFYRIQKPIAGEWQIIIDAVDVQGQEPFTVCVMGETVGVLFNAYTDKAQYTYPEGILIQALVVAEYPVAHAEVTGTVERPDGSSVDIILFDDGLGAHGDEFADDGFYSNFFSAYTVDGVYTFNLVVDNKEGIEAPGGCEIPPEGWTPAPIPPFTREASVSVYVSGVPVEAYNE